MFFCLRYFVEEEAMRKERESESLSNKQRVDRQETEQFYLAKFREYILNSNRISRLQAKYDHIRKCLGEHSCSSATATLPRPITNSRRRIGRTMRAGQPKLFGGSLEVRRRSHTNTIFLFNERKKENLF
jgi:SLIT-ROBO Rho GTPase activating protein